VDVLGRAGSSHAEKPLGIDAAFWPTLAVTPGRTLTFLSRTFGRDEPGKEVWDFGDGTPAVAVRSDGNRRPWAHGGYASLEHAYAKPGDYIVAVRTADADGITARVHLWVHVEED